jgi:hypothetical protein
MSVEYLNQPHNVVPQPDIIIARDLTGAAVNVSADPILAPGTVAIDLEPPEAFRVVHNATSGQVRIGSAEDQQGGTVGVRMGPGVRVSQAVIETTDADVSAHGSPDMPLLFSSLGLRTSGPGEVSVSHVELAANLRVRAASVNHLRLGTGIIALGQVIKTTD